MKKTPTELMKELKFIESEIARLNYDSRRKSSIPLDENMKSLFETDFKYEDYRDAVRELLKRQLTIKSALSKFNSKTKAFGSELTIAEALVRISQLKNEIDSLKYLAERNEYSLDPEGSNRDSYTWKTSYNPSDVVEDVKKLESELAALRIAVDRTNLTVSLDI